MPYEHIAAAAFLFLCFKWFLQWKLNPREVRIDFVSGEPSNGETLLVMVHGLSGRKTFDGAVSLARSSIPGADVLAVDYDGRFFCNTDPYVVSDAIERKVHHLASQRNYRSIVLVGHSAGGAIARKVFVWAHGAEDDRERFGRQGKRDWINHVDRIVLLAGINRGYSISPKPSAMSASTYLKIWLALSASRIFSIGRLARSMYRGEPFVADTRVQWLRVARSDGVVDGSQPFPTVIQLLGSEDDIVSREDSLDLAAARGTWFKTLPQTNHYDIGASLDRPGGTEHEARVLHITQALVGDLHSLEPDVFEFPPEYRNVTRLIYVMHGIRDYGYWTDVVRQRIEELCATRGESAAVINHKYGYFPMLPFIIYSDRQTNVRRFMDDYTESLSNYPNARTMDFIGHSNGTYILASALMHYHTLRVRRVFFAGSVVPKHYPWIELIRVGRVQQVVNVVATRDWVVALFPKLFEQIADWIGSRPVRGWLDIGAAGFRGFLDAGGASGMVTNLNFATGTHSTGVEVSNPAKLQAITAYVVDGDSSQLVSFKTSATQDSLIDTLSNASYIVWLGLFAIISTLGWLVATAWAGPGLMVYAALLFALLHSI